MEEYDDLAAGPKDGTLNLSHNTWKTLPPELSSFSTSLLHLEMSNNQLSVIPASIKDLVLLKSLDVSLNQIESICKDIGNCTRLRRLNVASNRIESLPVEISQCIMLEDIIARDNRLLKLPRQITNLLAISSIDVRNNKLESVPLRLCRVPTLNTLLCEGNCQLVSAPSNMRGTSELLLFCLEMQQKFKDVIDPKIAQRDDIQVNSRKIINDLQTSNCRIEKLEKEIASLEWERPDKYIYWKGRLIFTVKYCLDKLILLLNWANLALFRRWHVKKTHPLF